MYKQKFFVPYIHQSLVTKPNMSQNFPQMIYNEIQSVRKFIMKSTAPRNPTEVYCVKRVLIIPVNCCSCVYVTVSNDSVAALGYIWQ